MSTQDKARLAQPNKGIKTWFNGEVIQFTGDNETMYGEVFYLAKYITGHLTGRECSVASNLVERGFVRIA